MDDQKILALFDIDGTILSSGTGARTALSQAIFEVIDKSFKIEPGMCAGKTDPLIVASFLEEAGCLTEELPKLLPMVKERYIELLRTQYNKKNDAFLYPGIPELLEKISEQTNIYLGLLTGNYEQGARIKLDPFHINPLFPIGAFGDDGFVRTDLSRIAVQRAEEYYKVKFDSENIVVIGDTADDVACGKILNARTIGISRRKETLETLKASEPDHIFAGSENVDEIVKAILG
ncbi:HAD family hydrolase [candidate division KSB1 bacterium]